jgi:hypothetical protein
MTDSDTLNRRIDIIEPAWWTGTPAVTSDVYEIDCSRFAMNEADLVPDSELATLMRHTFDDVGLVHLTNTRLTDLGEMRLFAKIVLEAEMEYRAGANPRSPLAPNVYDVGAPLQAWLHYHHEMAYVSTSTKMLGFLCKRELPGRGATYLSDNLAATEALMATEFGKKLRDLGVCYRRNLSDREAFVGQVPIGVYNHWQKSLGTDDPTEAETRAMASGLKTEWGPNRTLQTRFYVSAFEYLPQLDRNVLYSSIADHSMWFDSWPLVEQIEPRERPLWMTFGDDSDFTHDELQQYVDVYDNFGTPLDWRVGDVGVVCNYRFAHGRPAVHLNGDEERELGVMLGEPFERVGDLPHAW